jgi:hypothetical protein
MGIIPMAFAALAAITLGLGTYANHLRGEVKEREALVLSQQETMAGLRLDVAERDLSITALKTSRDTVNDRLRTLIAANNTAVDAEIERRKQVESERNKAKEALRIALDNISTVSANDETFKTWLAQPVPRAAWDRLRDAAE